MLMRALGKVDIDCSGFLTALVERRVKGQLEKYRPRQIKEVVWVHARHDIPSEELFREIAEHMEKRLPEFEVRQLAVITWAYARLSHSAPKLFEGIARRISNEKTPLFPLDVSNLAWAMAKQQVNDPDLLKVLGQNVTANIEQYSGQSLSNTLWAFATLEYYDVRLMDVAAIHVRKHLQDYSDQSIANIAWAYASLRHFSHPFMMDISQAARPRLSGLDSRFLSHLVYSFATFGLRDGILLSAVSKEVLRRLQEGGSFPRDALVLLAWSLAVLRWYPQTMMTELRRHLAKIPDFSSQQLCQLFQVELALRLEAPQMGQVAGGWELDSSAEEYLESLWIAGHLRVQAKTCWERENLLERRHVSAFQTDVSATLKHMGIHHKMEHMEGDYSIDIALLMKEGALKVALEADGPTHFTSNQRSRPLGATLLKARLLQKLGWGMVQVPYFHWMRLSNINRKEAYLWEKLETFGIRRSGGDSNRQLHESSVKDSTLDKDMSPTVVSSYEEDLTLIEDMETTFIDVTEIGSNGEREGRVCVSRSVENGVDLVKCQVEEQKFVKGESFVTEESSAQVNSPKEKEIEKATRDESSEASPEDVELEKVMRDEGCEALELKRMDITKRAEILSALKVGRGQNVNNLKVLTDTAVRRSLVKKSSLNRDSK